MIVTKKISIDMGHRVPNHKSKCHNFHGHRYDIEVGVDDKIITKKGASNEGMVIDFGDLKQIMMDKIDKNYDHGFVIYIKDKYINSFKQMQKDGLKIIIVDFIPTAENLSKLWFNIMDIELKKHQIKLKYVKVWETPTSSALATHGRS